MSRRMLTVFGKSGDTAVTLEKQDLTDTFIVGNLSRSFIIDVEYNLRYPYVKVI